MSGLTRHMGPRLGGAINVTFVDDSAIGTSSSNPSITAPASRLAGDRMSLLAMIRVSDTITNPSGWTLGTAVTNAYKSFHRTADGTGTDSPTIAGSLGATVAGLVALRSTGTTWVFGAADESFTTSLVVPSATAAGAGQEVLHVLAWNEFSLTLPTISTPAGFTLLGTLTGTFTSTGPADNAYRASVFKRAVTASGAVGTTTVTLADSDVALGAKVLVSA